MNVIFGANGSGKSSLCDALKVLASLDKPLRPLANARLARVAKGAAPAAPSFEYKFSSDVSPRSWTELDGYGTWRSAVRYFDSSVATRSIRESIDPGRVVEIAPFHLGTFDDVRALTISFRDELARLQAADQTALDLILGQLRTDFVPFPGSALAQIASRVGPSPTTAALQAQIALGKAFVGDAELATKSKEAQELKKATSEDGLKLLSAEARELDSLIQAVEHLLSKSKTLWTTAPGTVAAHLTAKRTAQKLLAAELLPDAATAQGFLAVLQAAAAIWAFEDATGESCGLCRRPLERAQVELFGKYHTLLNDKIAEEIKSLESSLLTSTALLACPRPR